MKKNNKKWQKVISVIVDVILILWLVYLTAHIFLTGKFWLWNLFANIPPVFFLIIPLFILLLEIIKGKMRILHLILILAAIITGCTQIDLNIPVAQDKSLNKQNSTQGTQIKLLSWNANYWDMNKDKDQFYAFIKNTGADIYLLQEYIHAQSNGDWIFIDDSERIKKEFPDYYVVSDDQFITMSRFPIIKSYLGPWKQLLVTDIEINNKAYRFFNVHINSQLDLATSLFSAEYYKLLKDKFTERANGFLDLYNEIEKTATDYVIAGDFNSTMAMGKMQRLFSTHIDSQRYEVNLFPTTFRIYGLRLWRLDYLFIKNHPNQTIFLLSHKQIDTSHLSDHTGIMVNLLLK